MIDNTQQMMLSSYLVDTHTIMLNLPLTHSNKEQQVHEKVGVKW